jgi:hypothetical protein
LTKENHGPKIFPKLENRCRHRRKIVDRRFPRFKKLRYGRPSGGGDATRVLEPTRTHSRTDAIAFSLMRAAMSRQPQPRRADEVFVDSDI